MRDHPPAGFGAGFFSGNVTDSISPNTEAGAVLQTDIGKLENVSKPTIRDRLEVRRFPRSDDAIRDWPMR